MIFLFFGTSLALLEAELAPFKDWEDIGNICSSSCHRERLLSNSPVASLKQIVIIIIKCRQYQKKEKSLMSIYGHIFFRNFLCKLFFRIDQRLSVTLSNNSNGVLTILMSSFLCLPTWYSFINTKQPSCNSKIMDDMELWTNKVKHPSGLSTNTAFAAWCVARLQLVRPMAIRWQHCRDCNAGVGLASIFILHFVCIRSWLQWVKDAEI